MEYILRGGATGKDIQTNHPNWNGSMMGGPYVLVDGKQRLNAILGFLNNEFEVFGKYRFKDFEGRPDVQGPLARQRSRDLRGSAPVVPRSEHRRHGPLGRRAGEGNPVARTVGRTEAGLRRCTAVA